MNNSDTSFTKDTLFSKDYCMWRLYLWLGGASLTGFWYSVQMPSSPINCQVTAVDGFTEGVADGNGIMVDVNGSKVFRLYTNTKNNNNRQLRSCFDTFYYIFHNYIRE